MSTQHDPVFPESAADGADDTEGHAFRRTADADREAEGAFRRSLDSGEDVEGHAYRRSLDLDAGSGAASLPDNDVEGHTR